MSTFPATDLVILAGGQSQRMNGANKLLLTFDDEIQLMKIYNAFKNTVHQIWINSHRDSDIYRCFIPNIHYYQDDIHGFLGPLMGIKSAWSYIESDYALFIPCDITFIPPLIIDQLHYALQQNPKSKIAYVKINNQPLYPFCLLKRESLEILRQHIENKQLSLKYCFNKLSAQSININNKDINFHSLNSFNELEKYK